jgi:integrase/recombinase XerD
MTSRKTGHSITELVAIEATAAALLPEDKRESLIAWFELYMGTQVGDPASNTFRAKKSDLQKFIEYLLHASGTDHPDQWTKSVTESFLRKLYKKQNLAASTVNRALATLRHSAQWIHKQRPFLVGNPCQGVRNIDEDEPEWLGLEDLQVNRLRSAAEQLVAIQTRSNQRPRRNYAMFLTLLHLGLRESEMLDLRFPIQYADGYFHNIKRKGKKITKKLRVPKPVREAIEVYFDEERGREPGPLFQSKNGLRLAPQNLDDVLKAITAQANSTLPKPEQIHLSAHMLSHTALRKAAEKDTNERGLVQLARVSQRDRDVTSDQGK